MHRLQTAPSPRNRDEPDMGQSNHLFPNQTITIRLFFSGVRSSEDDHRTAQKIGINSFSFICASCIANRDRAAFQDSLSGQFRKFSCRWSSLRYWCPPPAKPIIYGGQFGIFKNHGLPWSISTEIYNTVRLDLQRE